MKKILKNRIFVALFLALLFSFSVQAEESRSDTKSKSEEPVILLPLGQRESSDRQESLSRGSLISSAFSSITNIGGGKIEVLLETLAHRQCDSIRHVGYLERWIEEDQIYEQVARYEFIEYATDHPDESFTGMTHVVIVDDQPSGYYYRVRGTHNVYLNGETEGLSTRTNGVMITK